MEPFDNNETSPKANSTIFVVESSIDLYSEQRQLNTCIPPSAAHMHLHPLRALHSTSQSARTKDIILPILCLSSLEFPYCLSKVLRHCHSPPPWQNFMNSVWSVYFLFLFSVHFAYLARELCLQSYVIINHVKRKNFPVHAFLKKSLFQTMNILFWTNRSGDMYHLLLMERIQVMRRVAIVILPESPAYLPLNL